MHFYGPGSVSALWLRRRREPRGSSGAPPRPRVRGASVASRRAMAARWWRLRPARLRPVSAELESEEARMEQRRRTQSARLRRLQRLMEPPEPPGRSLSCQAMEQMRSLRQDSPEEWPVARLACSFEVSPEVVRRVLRSRFSPSPERGLKQDSRLSTSRAGAEALAPALAAQRKRVGSGAPPPGTSHPHKPGAELTARAQQQQQQQQPRLRVVQKGREFVDENGNLLYRIPA